MVMHHHDVVVVVVDHVAVVVLVVAHVRLLLLLLLLLVHASDVFRLALDKVRYASAHAAVVRVVCGKWGEIRNTS